MMSLKKAIKYGKEHRKEYRGAKSVDPSCRNHKGCDWCKGNRTYQSRKQMQKINEQLKEVKNNDNSIYSIKYINNSSMFNRNKFKCILL